MCDAYAGYLQTVRGLTQTRLVLPWDLMVLQWPLTVRHFLAVGVRWLDATLALDLGAAEAVSVAATPDSSMAAARPAVRRCASRLCMSNSFPGGMGRLHYRYSGLLSQSTHLDRMGPCGPRRLST